MDIEQFNQLYERHLQSMIGADGNNPMSNQDVDLILNRLISILPNNGKLYKYRNIGNQQNYLDVINSINNKSLWASRVDLFQDGTDGTICYDLDNEIKNLRLEFSQNPILLYRFAMYCFPVEQYNVKFDRGMILQISNYIDVNEGKLLREKVCDLFYSYGYNIETTDIGINLIQDYLDAYVDDNFFKTYVEKFIKDYNKQFKEHAYACCLCGSFDNGLMWDNYGRGNGICIEYDYKKLVKQPYDTKRIFCSTFKMNYANCRYECNLSPGIISVLKNGHGTRSESKLRLDVISSTLTKRIEYLYENEWRILTFDFISKLEGIAINADLISSIIINEKTLLNGITNEIISECKRYGYLVKIRKLNDENTQYEYLELDKYLEMTKKVPKP